MPEGFACSLEVINVRHLHVGAWVCSPKHQRQMCILHTHDAGDPPGHLLVLLEPHAAPGLSQHPQIVNTSVETLARIGYHFMKKESA